MTNLSYEIKLSTRQELHPYIKRCIHFSSLNESGMKKSLWPEPNIVLLFNFTKTKLNEEICSDVVVVGLHDAVHAMQPEGNEVDVIILHFTGTGFSFLSRKNAIHITGRTINAKDVFGEAIIILFNEMRLTNIMDERQVMLDNFFLLLLEKSQVPFPYLGDLTFNLQTDPEFNIPQDTGITYRHLSRIFKQKIGVNIKTFRRLCRFEIAKTLLIKEQSNSLTEIGYRSAYYDQAHFAKDFKKLSGLRAKYFEPLCFV